MAFIRNVKNLTLTGLGARELLVMPVEPEAEENVKGLFECDCRPEYLKKNLIYLEF